MVVGKSSVTIVVTSNGHKAGWYL